MLFLRNADANASQSSYDDLRYALRWKVYPSFIPDGDQIICKIYMTRVEGENTRLRHYLGGAYAPDRRPDGTGRECVRFTSQNSLLFQI